MRKLCINILSPLGLTSTGDARDIFAAWVETLPSLVPERVGNYEPLRAMIRCPDLSDALQFWRWPLFLASRRKPRMHCQIYLRGPNVGEGRHSSLCFEFTAGEAAQLGALAFLQSLCELVGAEFAAMEAVGDDYLDYGERSGTIGYVNVKRTKWSFCLSTPGLSRGIPDIYWATVFGNAYVTLFGRERIRTCPVFAFKELGYGGVMLQLTTNVTDSEQVLRPVREAVKRHLNPLAFRGSDGFPAEEVRAASPGPFDSSICDTLSKATALPKFDLCDL